MIMMENEETNILTKRIQRCVEEFPDRETFCRERGTTSGKVESIIMIDFARQMREGDLAPDFVLGNKTDADLDHALIDVFNKAIQGDSRFKSITDLDKRATYEEVMEMFECALRIAKLWAFA
jgi:hypothetical protein